MNLQHRIILSVVIGLSVVMIIFGYAAADSLGKSIQAAYQTRLVLARTVAGDLDATIERSMDILEKTASLDSFTAGNDAARHQIIRDTQYRIGSFAAITFLDASGRLLMSAPDQSGRIGSNLLYHPSAAAVIRTGQPQVGELPAQLDAGVPMVCLAVPVKDEADRIAGVLMAELDPRSQGFLLQPGDTGGARLIQLLDHNGGVIASTGAGTSPVDDDHGKQVAILIVNHRAGAVSHVVSDGSSHILAYAPLASMPDWGVAVELPAYSVLALPGELRNHLIIFGVLALVAAVVAAWIDVQRVVKPLRHLSAAANRIRSGDVATPIAAESGDEVGMLARALDAMRRALHESAGARNRYEADLESRVQQRTAEVVTLLGASEAFASTLDLTALLPIVLRESRRVCPSADAGVVVLFEPEIGLLVPAASFGCDVDHLSQIRLKPGESVAGRVFETATPTLLTAETFASGNRDLGPANAKYLDDACPRLKEARTVLCVPLIGKGRPIGSLLVAGWQPESMFSEAELRVLQVIANHASLAVESAQLHEELRSKDELRGKLLAKVITAQEEERRRLARDLHDEPAQALTALAMEVDAVVTDTPDLPERQREKLVRTRALAQHALGNVRQMIWDLRPTILDELGLVSAVRYYAQRHLEARDTQVNISSTGSSERLPSQVETEVYRVLQEAIANIAKHAQATRATIRFCRANGTLQATIEDDGCGFEVQKPADADEGSGLGLLGMRERVALLGGSLSIRSARGVGTRVTVNVPVESKG